MDMIRRNTLVALIALAFLAFTSVSYAYVEVPNEKPVDRVFDVHEGDPDGPEGCTSGTMTDTELFGDRGKAMQTTPTFGQILAACLSVPIYW